MDPTIGGKEEAPRRSKLSASSLNLFDAPLGTRHLTTPSSQPACPRMLLLTATCPARRYALLLPPRVCRQKRQLPDPGKLPMRASPTAVNNFSTRSAPALAPEKANERSKQLSSHFPHSRAASSSSSQQPSTMAQTTLPSRGGFDPKAPSVFTTRKVGALHTLEHRIYIEKDGVPVSIFHDIPLYANEQQTVLNMVVEIPRWTNAKQEVSHTTITPFTAITSMH